ncbi:MAG: response regulator [Spirochaetota bacterium]|nr:response regulator [Spirochaetota bacterium]
METQTNKSLNILVIEDNPAGQKLLGKLMNKQQYQVTLAENGSMALDILSSQSFDLVLTDIILPVMDGVEFCKALRNKEKEKGGYIPVIGLSAGNAYSRDECLAVGMDAYLTKPFDFNELIGIIHDNTAK